MTDPTESERLIAEARRHDKAATPGPWHVDHDWTIEVLGVEGSLIGKLAIHANGIANGAFGGLLLLIKGRRENPLIYRSSGREGAGGLCRHWCAREEADDG